MLGDTPNFFGPQPVKQQEEEVTKADSQGGGATAFMRSGHANVYRQEWKPLKAVGQISGQSHVGGQQHMMQQWVGVATLAWISSPYLQFDYDSWLCVDPGFACVVVVVCHGDDLLRRGLAHRLPLGFVIEFVSYLGCIVFRAWQYWLTNWILAVTPWHDSTCPVTAAECFQASSYFLRSSHWWHSNVCFPAAIC